MPTLENVPTFCFYLSEASGNRSRENIQTAAANLVPGSVVETRDAGVTWVGITNVDLTDDTKLAIVIGPAVTGDVAVIYRDAEVIASRLSYTAGVTGGRKTAALARLAAQGVIARS